MGSQINLIRRHYRQNYWVFLRIGQFLDIGLFCFHGSIYLHLYILIHNFKDKLFLAVDSTFWFMKWKEVLKTPSVNIFTVICQQNETIILNLALYNFQISVLYAKWLSAYVFANLYNKICTQLRGNYGDIYLLLLFFTPFTLNESSRKKKKNLLALMTCYQNHNLSHHSLYGKTCNGSEWWHFLCISQKSALSQVCNNIKSE